MRYLKNTALFLMALGTKPFHIQNTVGRNKLSKIKSTGLPEDKSPTPDILNYIAPDGSAKTFPAVGKEFKKLNKEMHDNILKTVSEIGGPFFTYLCNNRNFSINDVSEIIVGEKEDFNRCDAANCYNFATRTEHQGKYINKFPGSKLPKLTSENQKDNCDSLKENVFEEFGDNVRLVSQEEECKDDELGFKTYTSREATFSNQRDYHFVRTPQNWHKRGAFPAEPLDEASIKTGCIKPKNALWIETVNNDIEADAKGEIDGIGRVSTLYTESEAGPTYDECDKFCLKVSQERGNTSANQLNK